ncbi:hypothetical protein U1E44_15800 [Arenibacter sp. GZD96]|uniref:hypothetical protein n=1 Tax=Aurantibrevibacter litoralis TaxID=3106030 RepID=UPI002AFEB23E|nr:hypothetical protein [Arenibacter sp. GZD-96]MEA1787566.1 hypothetical protein [Arenibacter sp. GZD-96]
MTFDTEFKEAIANLPVKEKDKLLLRLLKKDLPLANRLRFELLSTISVDERRIQMEAHIKKRVLEMTDSFYSPGYLLMDIRYLSGAINEHVAITKDKFGEASLNLLMLNEVLALNLQKIEKAPPSKSHKLYTYIVAKVFKILLLIRKLHEDCHLDFEAGLQQLGVHIGNYHGLMKASIYNGLDVNWLLQGNIPENIADIHRDLRNRGYLR